MVEGSWLPVVGRDGQQQGKREEDDDQKERADRGTRGRGQNGYVNEIAEAFEGVPVEPERALRLTAGTGVLVTVA